MTLTAATLEDCRQIAGFLADPRAAAVGTGGHSSQSSLATELEHLLGSPRHRVIAVRLSDSTIGGVMIKNIDPWNRNAELGYGLAPSHWGKGLGRYMAESLVRMLFVDMGLHRVYGYTMVRNRRSIAMCTAFGAKVEGVLPGDIVVDGQAEDRVVMGVLCDEALTALDQWLARRRRIESRRTRRGPEVCDRQHESMRGGA